MFNSFPDLYDEMELWAWNRVKHNKCEGAINPTKPLGPSTHETYAQDIASLGYGDAICFPPPSLRASSALSPLSLDAHISYCMFPCVYASTYEHMYEHTGTRPITDA